MRINLIAASRQRPDRMSTILEKWLESADNSKSIKVVISIDDSDQTSNQYYELLPPIAEKHGTDLLIIKNPNTSSVEAINAAKSHIDGDLIVVFSDDFDCPEHWDTQLVKISSSVTGKHVIKISDGIGKDLITMPIFSRDYLDSFPFIYNPVYTHMFCDTELTCVAHLLGCVVEAPELTFQHMHYTQLYHHRDEIDEKNQSTFYSGMEIFKRRLGKKFDLDRGYLPGKIPSEIINWVYNK
jgi:hypothetical protein